MNANEMTFGVEIETTVPAGRIEIGGYSRAVQALGLPAGWQAKGDGSIHGGRGRTGCEFVSPVLTGAAGLQSVVEAVRAIKAMGGRVNRSCGLHVHVGYVAQAETLARLVSLVANFERAIYASTGTHARERGTYCRGVQAYGQDRNAIANTGTDRYHLINLTNILGRGHGYPTVEFRAFAGTLNIVKIIGAIRMAIGLAQRAAVASRKTNWTAITPVATSPIHRAGVGQTELTRLFYQLGWTRGRAKQVYGEIAGAGVPTIKACKKMMMDMARKYDGEGA